MVPVAFVSAFLNNTPVVAIMIPILQKWSKKCGISPSQLFIPLSFASILGGTCTLIGTSTNLVVEGMMRERYPDARPIGMFDLSMYGVPVALSRASPTSSSSHRSSSRAARGRAATRAAGWAAEDSLAVGAVVAPGSSVINQPAATLRGLGLYLVSVQRGDMLLRAVTPEFLLEEGDVLLHFTGLIESIGEVCSEHGLLPLTHEVEEHIAAGKLGPVAEDEDGSFGKVNVPGGMKASIVSTDPALVSLPPHPGNPGKARSTDTFPPPRASTHRGGAKPRKVPGSDYKTVLHAFSMDDDATNEGSRRGGSAYHSNASDNEGGYTSAERGGYTSGGYSGYSSGGGDAPTQSADEIDRHQPAVRRRRRSSNASNMPRPARRRISSTAARRGRAAGRGRARVDDEFLLTATGDGSERPTRRCPSTRCWPRRIRPWRCARRCWTATRSSAAGSATTPRSSVGPRSTSGSGSGTRQALIAATLAARTSARSSPSSKLADVKFEPGDILMLHCLDKCPLLQFREPAIGGGGSEPPRRAGIQPRSDSGPGGSTPFSQPPGTRPQQPQEQLSREESGREGRRREGRHRTRGRHIETAEKTAATTPRGRATRAGALSR